MTKQQYIEHWVKTAENDWDTVDVLIKAKKYSHGLFWAHLVLEKLAKAHWVKTHADDIPPKVHNVVWLLEESNVPIAQEDKEFLEIFNRFQLSTRYPDYINKIEKLCTKQYADEQMQQVKKIRQCLLKMLQ